MTTTDTPSMTTPTPRRGQVRRERTSTRGLVVMLALLAVIALAVMQFADGYNSFLFVTFLTAAIAAVGLNLLMGTAGQVSIGNAAFLAVGAFSAVFMDRAGVPMGVSVFVAALVAAMVGLVVGIPALRIRGIYLALATFAAHFIILFAVERYQAGAVGDVGFYLTPRLGSIGTGVGYWPIVLVGALALVVALAASVTSGDSGRVMRVVRDQEEAAGAMGVRVARAKLFVFTMSSGMVGFAGALAAYVGGTVSSSSYTLHLAIIYLAMILIGGTDSILGAVIGAAIISWLPQLSGQLTGLLFSENTAALFAPQMSQVLYGSVIVLCILVAPGGIVGWCKELRDRYESRRTANAEQGQHR